MVDFLQEQLFVSELDAYFDGVEFLHQFVGQLVSQQPCVVFFGSKYIVDLCCGFGYALYVRCVESVVVGKSEMGQVIVTVR